MCRGISASNCPTRTELHWQSNQIPSNQIKSNRWVLQKYKGENYLRVSDQRDPLRMSRSVTTEEGYWWWSDLCCFELVLVLVHWQLAVGSQCQAIQGPRPVKDCYCRLTALHECPIISNVYQDLMACYGVFGEILDCGEVLPGVCGLSNAPNAPNASNVGYLALL